MSFILDALKKSQEEREQRQSPPGTLAASFQPVYPEDDVSVTKPLWLWLIIALLGVVAVLLLLLLLTLKDRPQLTAPPAASATLTAPAPETSETVLKATQPPVVVEAPMAARASEPTPAPLASTPPASVKPAAVPASEPVTAQVAKPTSATKVASRTVTEPPVNDPDDSLQTVQESPAVDVQQTPPYQVLKTIPDLEITGHLYSTLADKRYVNMNGRVWHEGDYLSEQIRITSITPDGLILDAGGWKIAVGRSQGWQALR